MSTQDRQNEPKHGARPGNGSIDAGTANVEKSQEEHSRESGRWGADEPDYGRPRGDKPEAEPKGEPNPHGSPYEEGGRYPGTRETTDKTQSRSAEPGQSSYGGFKNEDPGYQRQERPQDKKS